MPRAKRGNAMKQSELNHLRRLLGWVACEIGQDPAEMVAMVQRMASKLGEPTDESKQRLVEGYDDAKKVPKYVREAVKALRPLVGNLGDVVDVQEHHKTAGGAGVLQNGRSRSGPIPSNSTELERLTPKQKLDALLGDRPVPRVLPEDIQNL